MKRFLLLILAFGLTAGSAGAGTITVKAIGDDGWYADDVRDNAGVDLVGLTLTHYGKPGQTPTVADDLAIGQRLLFVEGPGGVPALQFHKTSTPGNGKVSLSRIDPAGLAPGSALAGPQFFARFPYYTDTTNETAVIKFGVRSTLWGADVGQSQNGFTALRSGEPAWDLIIVCWLDTPVAGSWQNVDLDADDAIWAVYRQSGNPYFNAPPAPWAGGKRSLNQWAASTEIAKTIGGVDHTWADVLFGAGAQVVAIQFGVGSSAGDCNTYIDWMETNVYNGGDRVEFSRAGLADLAFDPPANGPIACGHPVLLSFNYAPDAATPDLRGYNVVITTTGSGITFGPADFTDALPFAPTPDYFTVLETAPGVFTVSSAQLGGSAGLDHAATLFTLLVHPTGTGSATVDVTAATLRDLDNGPIGVALLGDAAFTVDCDPPAAADGVTAAPGHQKVLLDWTDSPDGDVVAYAIFRGLWYDTTPGVSAYPEYDDLAGDVVPTRPASAAAAFASPEWQLAATLPAGGAKPWTDVIAPRGVYYYEVFPMDAAGNFGPPAPTNDRATNYWLGDLEPWVDGYVANDDVTELGATFGESDGSPLYDNWADIGPTDDNSRLGIPTTDSRVDFEDLMIVAMNYGFTAPRAPAAPATGTVALTLAPIDATTWSLSLVAPCAALKGLRVAADLPAGSALVGAGALLREQAAPVFLRNLDASGLDASLAVLGTGVGLAGAGELLRLTLPAGTPADAVRLDARGVGNEPLTVALGGPPAAAWSLSPNVPNPFNPSTRIAYSLAAAGTVRLAVYSLDGRLVRTLVTGEQAAGPHDVTWDGCDADGRAVASGTYVCRIEAGSYVESRKMMLMK